MKVIDGKLKDIKGKWTYIRRIYIITQVFNKPIVGTGLTQCRLYKYILNFALLFLVLYAKPYVLRQ